MNKSVKVKMGKCGYRLSHFSVIIFQDLSHKLSTVNFLQADVNFGKNIFTTNKNFLGAIKSLKCILLLDICRPSLTTFFSEVLTGEGVNMWEEFYEGEINVVCGHLVFKGRLLHL